MCHTETKVDLDILEGEPVQIPTYKMKEVWRSEDWVSKGFVFEFNTTGKPFTYVNGQSVGEGGMDTVTVKKDDLLKKIKENREIHREVFEAALEGYRKNVIERLEKLLQEAREGRRIDHTIHLPVPMDMTREYDQAVAMLEMSIDDEIELTDRQFACYVMDRWSWKRQFASSNKSYLDSLYTMEGRLPEKYNMALSEE